MTGQISLKLPQLSPIGFNKFDFGVKEPIIEQESPKFSSSSTANGSTTKPYTENDSPPNLRLRDSNRFSKHIQLDSDDEMIEDQK